MPLSISETIEQLYQKVQENQQEILAKLDNLPASVWSADDRTVTDINADTESSGMTQAEHDALFSVVSKADNILDKDSFNQADRDTLLSLNNYDDSQLQEKAQQLLDKDSFNQTDRDKLNELENVDISSLSTKEDIDAIPTASEIAISVWNTSDNELLDKINNDLSTLMDFQMGNWAIVENQMVFYKRDGSLLAKFDLLNKNRNPSETSIYYRELDKGDIQ